MINDRLVLCETLFNEFIRFLPGTAHDQDRYRLRRMHGPYAGLWFKQFLPDRFKHGILAKTYFLCPKHVFKPAFPFFVNFRIRR